ncbi:hypothetical protein Rsub_05664 [Raphidocelis subcapitata]|uniref:UDP-N-acetylglucosamine diphosphorylase n=1 Tax=Raphidocelis subcapitata TaxID=307507 RepID=A0A2V0P5B8_9CHLO|nr:hypothetical protein Rsub_05664 [Raphidocelis subcapitata]|eukprot:GBF93053.1 hypothetical protein Rsub_05664 [Raphidocelis subcapitata]
MSTPTTLAMAPPGSGELFPALRASGALSHLLRGGARHVEVNAVDDNLLWRPADPVFVGFAASRRADAAAKVVEPDSVPAAYAAAAAGFGAAAEAGELLDSVALQAPAVGSYYFSARCLERLADAYTKSPLAGVRLVPASGIPRRGVPPPMPQLPANLPPQARAQALAAAARAAEAAAAPRPVDGYALQRFVGDALRLGDLIPAGSVQLLGVVREEEFAPLFGRGPNWATDGPDDAASRVLGLHSGWVEASGGEVVAEEGVEVSPLVSYAGEGLAPLVDGAAFDEPFDAALQGAGGAPGAAAGGAPHNAGPWVAPLAGLYAAGLAVALLKAAAGAVSSKKS